MQSNVLGLSLCYRSQNSAAVQNSCTNSCTAGKQADPIPALAIREHSNAVIRDEPLDSQILGKDWWSTDHIWLSIDKTVHWKPSVFSSKGTSFYHFTTVQSFSSRANPSLNFKGIFFCSPICRSNILHLKLVVDLERSPQSYMSFAVLCMHCGLG